MTQPRMTQRVAIQRNPTSGAGWREAELKRMINGLKARGLKPYLFSDRQKLAQHLGDPDFRADLLCIVAAGGDGTVDDLINRYPGIPLAIFAMGTENLLAKYCGIPRSGWRVAELIAHRHIRTIDLGQVEKRRFAVMASCGFDAEVVRLAHARRRGRITKLHYLRPILETWLNRPPQPLRLFFDDDPQPWTGEMAIISNIARYALNLPINPEAEDADGWLDVCLLSRAAPIRLLSKILQAKVTGRLPQPGVTFRRCQSLRLESEHPVAVQADGDPVTSTPCTIQLLPRALQLLVPPVFATSCLDQPKSSQQVTPPVT